LICDENNPRGCWKKGLVSQRFKEKDGQI